MFRNFDETCGIPMNDIMMGNLSSFVSSNYFWTFYPDVLLHRAMFVSFEMICLMGLLILGMFYQLRIRWHTSWLTVSLACLICGIVPYVVAKLVFLYGNLTVQDTGMWLAFMLLGILYAIWASGFFATLQLWTSHKPQPKISCGQYQQ
jgi:hypothetical protein